MKSKFLIAVLSFSLVQVIYGQENPGTFWDTGKQEIGQLCTKVGILGILPDLRCKTHEGSVHCNTNNLGVGTCDCNQGKYWAHQEGDGASSRCVGRVGAICTLEKTNFVPGKFCTPNAECVSEPGMSGHSVGRCRCLYGFKESPVPEGTCVVDSDIEDGDRSTPRTTTTTEAPPRGDFQLPPLDLIIGTHIATYGQECHSKSLLNRTYCATFSNTVSCQNKRCQCNMGEDSTIFDSQLNMCVGRAGSYCLNKRSLFGYKVCTSGADCVVEGEGYSLGVCECLYGYIAQPDGTCLRDTDISDPSTAKPIFPPSTTPDGATTPGSGGGGGGESGAKTYYSSGILSVVIMSAIAILQI